jgi:hypothetical protein
MAMLLTRDEQRVLQYLASGRNIEEIAATLNWPLQAVRWTCTHPLLAWVLDELEASATQADSPWAGREVSQGRAIVDYLWGIARRWARRVERARPDVGGRSLATSLPAPPGTSGPPHSQ